MVLDDADRDDATLEIFRSGEIHELARFRVAREDVFVFFGRAIDENVVNLAKHLFAMRQDAGLDDFEESVEAFVLGRVG